MTLDHRNLQASGENIVKEFPDDESFIAWTLGKDANPQQVAKAAMELCGIEVSSDPARILPHTVSEVAIKAVELDRLRVQQGE